MVSSARMLFVGIAWIVGIFTLAVFAFFGSAVFQMIAAYLMTIKFIPLLAPIAGGMWWFGPLYYTLLLVLGIVLTYRCYQEVIAVTDYFPDRGTY